MRNFIINHTDVCVSEKAVKKNEFIGRIPKTGVLPNYNDIKALLPKPIWQGHSDYIDCYEKTWEIAFSNLKNANYKGEAGFVSDFIDTAFNGELFMWDSVFILMFGRYASKIFNFQGTLDNFYAHQYEDGYICRQIREDIFADRWSKDDPCSTGPNLLAWSEWEYYNSTHDKKRLRKVFYPILAYHKWLRLNRTWKDGSYWACGYSCGLDNQKRVRAEYNTYCSHGFMSWIDANAQMYLSADLLIKINKELGLNEDLTFLEEEKKFLKKFINKKMWDEKTAFYYDLEKDGKISGYKSIVGYWPMLAGIVPKSRIEKLVSHLNNEKEFKRKNRVPTLPADNPCFNARGGYWNGGVWAPTNYMVLRGLDNYGYYDFSHQIAKDYLKNIIEVFNKDKTLYENYAPDFAMPDSTHKDFVGWTGIGPIAVLFENVFGIKPYLNTNTLEWHVNLLEEHGVKNYPFGEASVDLICLERKSKSDEPKIIVNSNKPIKVKIYYNGKSKTITSK